MVAMETCSCTPGHHPSAQNPRSTWLWAPSRTSHCPTLSAVIITQSSAWSGGGVMPSTPGRQPLTRSTQTAHPQHQNSREINEKISLADLFPSLFQGSRWGVNPHGFYRSFVGDCGGERTLLAVLQNLLTLRN